MADAPVFYSLGWGNPAQRLSQAGTLALALPTPEGDPSQQLVVAGPNLFGWSRLLEFLEKASSCWGTSVVALHTDQLANASLELIGACRSAGVTEVLGSALAYGNRLSPSKEHLNAVARLVKSGLRVWLELPIGWPALRSYAALAASAASGYCGVAGIEIRRGRLPHKDPSFRSALAQQPSLLCDATLALRDALGKVGVPLVLDLREGFPPCLFATVLHEQWPYGTGHTLAGLSLTKVAACEECAVGSQCSGIAPDLLPLGLTGLGTPLRSPPVRLLARKMSESSQADYGVWHGARRSLLSVRTFRDHLEHLSELDRRCVDSTSLNEADYRALDIGDLGGFRVALFIPPGWVDERIEDKNTCLPPLGLVQLASMLRAHGCKVSLSDLYVDPAFSAEDHKLLAQGERLRALLAGESDQEIERLLSRCVDRIGFAAADLVGMSCGTEQDAILLLLIARAARKRGIRVPVVVGRCFRFPVMDSPVAAEIDYQIAGAGEIPLTLLCASLARGTSQSWIPGLSWHRSGTLFANRPVDHSLDIQPPLDLTGLELDRYSYKIFTGWSGMTLPYQFITGCPYRCSFCNTPCKRRYRRRQPQLVVRDLQDLAERYGVVQFFFLNNLINVERRYCDELLERLARTGIAWRWTDCARPGGVSEALLAGLRRAGCECLTWGVDATSDRLSRLHNKNLRQEEMVSILRAASKAGIKNHVNLVPGLPGETEEDLDQAVAFFKSAGSWIDFLTLSPYQFISHSDLALYPERFGMKRSKEGGEGVDVVGGLRWIEQRERLTHSRQRLVDAAHQYLPRVSLL